MSKLRIVITGGNGLLGSHFKKKYTNKYNIIKYPHRIENFSKFDNWVKRRKFEFFIHFAAITRSESIKLKKKINLINVRSSINIIKKLNKNKIRGFQFFLFISSSHVYGFSKKSVSEEYKRNPINIYGKSKKNVEDYILKNQNKNYFKCGIARIFNTTGKNQKRGNFVPDMVDKIKKNNKIFNVNEFRDFIHIDDVCRSLEIILIKKVTRPVNISSGKKINLIEVCKKINNFFIKKKNLKFNKEKVKDLFGNNNYLKKLGMTKFKNIDQIIKAFKY